MNFKKTIQIGVALFIGAMLFIAFQSNTLAEKTILIFEETLTDFKQEQKNLRKWDSPVIADLDQDGYSDLILNDHGFGIRICWNNKGKFAKPYDLIMGDLHGISVGDFDEDGNQDIVISRGGGSGSNARNSKIYTVNKKREFTAVEDFHEPLALMRGRTVKLIDGDNDGDLDLLNFAFSSNVRKIGSENYIYENDGSGELVLASKLPAVTKDGQKTLVTDFNGDNVLDLLLYGEGKVQAFQGNGDLTYKNVTKKVLPNDLENVRGIVELDYDNDGDFDLFFVRGHDFKPRETFYNPSTEVWGFYTKRGKFKFDNLKMGDIMNLENYQSQWPLKDVYLGETGYDYEFSGETHSGRDIRLVNSDALGFPDEAPKKGMYIGYIGNQNWRMQGNIWSPATGIVRGVKSAPKSPTEHPKGLTDVLLENKNGKFKDVSKQYNFTLEEHSMAVTVADLDNNGYQDILITPRGNLVNEHKTIVYLNNGEAGFKMLHHDIESPELGAIGMCIETMDYNLDGKIDIITGHERGKWHLYKNEMQIDNNSKYLTVKVGHSPKGKKTGLGALVTVETCKGKQVQRVGSTGANYSLNAERYIHFGLNNCSETVKVKIIWSNGETAEQVISDFNKIITTEKH